MKRRGSGLSPCVQNTSVRAQCGMLYLLFIMPYWRNNTDAYLSRCGEVARGFERHRERSETAVHPRQCKARAHSLILC